MSAELVFGLLVLLGAVWTGVWVWVIVGSHRRLPYDEIAARTGMLRRRLLLFFLITGGIAFAVSMIWLPYAPVRALVLGQPAVTVDVTGEQWRWSFSRGEVPAGVPVEFRVTSTDVNHGFALYDPDESLVAQVQAMPGYTNRLIHVFERPGVYTVRCLELCGTYHHLMVSEITVTQ